MPLIHVLSDDFFPQPAFITNFFVLVWQWWEKIPPKVSFSLLLTL